MDSTAVKYEKASLEKRSSTIRASIAEKLYLFLVYFVVLAFALECILPFWIVVSNSFQDNGILATQGYQLYIKKFSLEAYSFLFSGKQVYASYRVTLFVTIFGTTAATLITSMYAFVLAHRKAKYRSIMSFMTYFTMIMGSGLVGYYLLISRWLHLKDTIWALVLPLMLNPFLTFVLVNFYRSVPYEVYESAEIDGANDVYTFFKIVFPMSKPGVATIVLFYALNYWNDWFNALLFINKDNLNPLQMMIRKLMSSISAEAYVGGLYGNSVPTQSVTLATVCITIGPIILLYPFVQRYFVKGMSIGAVKG